MKSWKGTNGADFVRIALREKRVKSARTVREMLFLATKEQTIH